MATTTEQTPTTVPVWRNPDFLKFWIGEAGSLLGAQVALLAVPLTAVLVLNAGPEALGLLRFLQMVPFLVFGLFLGVWIDRVRRLPVMIGANLARMILIGIIPVLAATHQLTMPILLVITFGVGIATVLFDVGWLSFVPSLVRQPAQLLDANAKLGATSSAADMTGPAVAGVLVGLLGAPLSLVINALTYLGSVGSLLLIRSREPAPPPPAERRRVLADIVEGLRWVFGNRYLRALTLVGAAGNFLVAATYPLFVLYAVRERMLPAGLLGVIMSVGAIGGLLGSFNAVRLTKRFGPGRLYVGALTVGFAAVVLIPAATGPRVVVVGFFLLAFLLTFAGISTANVLVLSLRQAMTPNRLMGRMNAAARTFMFGLGSLGALIGGLLGDLLGLRAALWAAAIGALVVLIPIILSPVSRLHEMPARISEDSETRDTVAPEPAP